MQKLNHQNTIDFYIIFIDLGLHNSPPIFKYSSYIFLKLSQGSKLEWSKFIAFSNEFTSLLRKINAPQNIRKLKKRQRLPSSPKITQVTKRQYLHRIHIQKLMFGGGSQGPSGTTPTAPKPLLGSSEDPPTTPRTLPGPPDGSRGSPQVLH